MSGVVLQLRSPGPLYSPSDGARSVLVDLIKDAAVGKMFLLRLGPAAEQFVDREQLDLGEGVCIFLGDLGITRAVEIARGDVLTFLGIPILKVGIGGVARALFIGNPVDARYRRLGVDRLRRRADL